MKSYNHGISISLIIHLIILAIPMSNVFRRNFNELELFILDERISLPKRSIKIKAKPVETKKEIVTAKEENPQPKVEETPLPQVIEKPDIKDVKKEAISMPAPEPVLASSPISSTISKEVKAEIVSSGKEEVGINSLAPSEGYNEDVEFGSAMGPKFLYREIPVYPLMAKKLGKEGKVLLRLFIDENGKLLDVEVIENGGYGFTNAAVEAVKKSTFQPALRNGKPIKAKALLTVRFQLRRD